MSLNSNFTALPTFAGIRVGYGARALVPGVLFTLLFGGVMSHSRPRLVSLHLDVSHIIIIPQISPQKLYYGPNL